MAAAELRDRRVIRRDVAGHNAVGDVLDARALDAARRPVPARIRVKQQRDHHRRLVGRPAVPVGSIVGVERRQIQLADGLQHRPHQVLLRHPVRHQRRHQKDLLTVTTDEPRAHIPKGPDQTGRHRTFSRQPRREAAVCVRRTDASRTTALACTPDAVASRQRTTALCRLRGKARFARRQWPVRSNHARARGYARRREELLRVALTDIARVVRVDAGVSIGFRVVLRDGRDISSSVPCA